MSAPSTIIKSNISSHAVTVHYKRHTRIKLLCIFNQSIYVFKHFLSRCTMTTFSFSASMAPQVHSYYSYSFFIKIICYSCKSACMFTNSMDQNHNMVGVFPGIMITCNLKISSFKLKILIHFFLLSLAVKK